MTNNARFWVVACMLAVTAAAVNLRRTGKVPPSVPLDLLPRQIAGWNGTDIPIDDSVLQVLGDGRFLNRIYTEQGAAQAGSNAVGLFIGYFPTQRTGQAIHSPQNCLPGAGWTFQSSGTTQFTDDSGKPYRVGEYIIANGENRDEVLYWYRSHGQNIAGDFAAKIYLIFEAIRYNRTDGALIRIITPFQPGETREAAHNRAVAFASHMTDTLPSFIPD